MTPTRTTFKEAGSAALTVVLALLIAAGILRQGTLTRAADPVCGDAVVESPEVCDDGNLRSGDGCSSACTVEACGNSVVDAGEQCDDGGTKDDDGCNRYCQIEFCGDSIRQRSGGEECDDGNGVSGDGCNASCHLEGGGHAAANEKDSSGEPDHTTDPNAPPPLTEPTVPPTVVIQAQQGVAFLQSPDGVEYRSYLSREDGLKLEMILKKLGSGRRLTKQEREWATALIEKLEEAKIAQRTRYTDLLRQFIATPISSEVVDEKKLQKTKLVDVEVPVAIDELKRAVEIVRRGELKQQVSLDLGRLKRQGIDLVAALPQNYDRHLDAGVRPIEVFATLKSLKEVTESYATKNVPASLELIRSEATFLRDALPTLQQEYGIRPADAEPLLTAIESLSATSTRQEVDRVVGAVNRFMSYLAREKIFSAADIASLDDRAKHAAATASRLVQESGRSDVVTTDDMVAFVDGLSSGAPRQAKPAFEQGTDINQRVALLQFLQNDVRTNDLREILRRDGRVDLDERYAELRAQIARVGSDDRDDTACDDTMEEALRCTSDYLSDLQDEVRNRSVFSRFIGTLQDYFGIGS